MTTDIDEANDWFQRSDGGTIWAEKLVE